MISVLSLILVAGVYYANYLGATGMWGMSINNLAQVFPFPFMPAGVFFGIARTLIFVLIGIFAIIAVGQYIRDGRTHKRTMTWFAISSVLNILWVYITALGYYAWSVLIIALIMVVLSQILNRLKSRNAQCTLGRWAIGAYYGWISIATTVLSLSMLVYLYDKTLVLSTTWSYIAIAIGMLVTICSWFRWRNPAALLLSFRGLIGALVAFLS